MLEKASIVLFGPLVGKLFRAQISDVNVVELELIQALALPSHPGLGGKAPNRAPFSLVFRGPKEFVLPQRIYPLEQETLGKAEIFLVPIGPDATGQRYEAIFN